MTDGGNSYGASNALTSTHKNNIEKINELYRNIVPQFIPPNISKVTGWNADDLTSLCREYNLTGKHLNGLVLFKQVYKCHFGTIVNMLEKGLNFVEIQKVLNTQRTIKEEGGNAPLSDISDFYQAFCGCDYDSNGIAEAILQVHESSGKPWVSLSIKEALTVAKEHDIVDLEHLLDYLKGEEDFKEFGNPDYDPEEDTGQPSF